MQNSRPFNLMMVSAMYENGGNTIHRFFDGHPELFVYPFESQFGTPLIADYLSSAFPNKYRWPDFSLSGNFADDYELIIDEELKRHIKTPFASKFKDADINMSDKERKDIFLRVLSSEERKRGAIVQAFMQATFDAWKNCKRSGKEHWYVGYSPIVGVDADKIFADFPNAHIIHVVRNPLAAYADTKKRPVPYSLHRYAQTWNIVQTLAQHFQTMFPNNFHIVRFEDLVSDSKSFFQNLLGKIGISSNEPTLEYPSWNGKKLEKTVPWGTILKATADANRETQLELSPEESAKVRGYTHITASAFGYGQ